MALGFSGVAAGSAISQYRTYFLILAFLLLGYAFYYTYKPGKAKQQCTKETCAPDVKKGFNFKSLNRTLLWIVAAVTLALAFLPSYMQFLHFKPKNQVSDEPCCPGGTKSAVEKGNCGAVKDE